MILRKKTNWAGVYPAITTQFNSDETLNIEATQRIYDDHIKSGVHGVIALGTVGENCSLSAQEKLIMLSAIKEAVNNRVPIIAGAAEYTTKTTIKYMQHARDIGIDGIMLLPGMVYKSLPDETIYHYITAARAVPDMPIMIYNNPITYGVDINISMLKKILENNKDINNIIAIKESSEDTRRVTEIFANLQNQLIVFSGVDDIAFEQLACGATGWISGITNAFPKEALALYYLIQQNRLQEARELYQWFMPILKLDTVTYLVQAIKLAGAMTGSGTEYVRAPRRPLAGDIRKSVIETIETALEHRPDLSHYSLLKELAEPI